MKIFYVGKHDSKINLALLIFRLLAGGLMLSHGLPKMMKLFSSEPIQFADPLGVGTEFSLILTIFAEVVCSLLLVLGLWTRAALIPLIVTMLVAVFIIHIDHDFGKKELGIIYLTLYVALLISGPGKYSLDYQIQRK